LAVEPETDRAEHGNAEYADPDVERDPHHN
jgi:hypothetical protein